MIISHANSCRANLNWTNSASRAARQRRNQQSCNTQPLLPSWGDVTVMRILQLLILIYHISTVSPPVISGQISSPIPDIDQRNSPRTTPSSLSAATRSPNPLLSQPAPMDTHEEPTKQPQNQVPPTLSQQINHSRTLTQQTTGPSQINRGAEASITDESWKSVVNTYVEEILK